MDEGHQAAAAWRLRGAAKGAIRHGTVRRRGPGAHVWQPNGHTVRASGRGVRPTTWACAHDRTASSIDIRLAAPRSTSERTQRWEVLNP
jgi:hypothetical protein